MTESPSASRPWANNYGYLCLNCGAIASFDEFDALRWDDEMDTLVAAPPGWEDPILRCPACKWEHTDDDANPGLIDGTGDELRDERAKLEAEYAELWAEPRS